MKFKRSDWIFFAVFAAAVAAVFGRSVFFEINLIDDNVYAGRAMQLTFTWENIKYWWKPVIGLWSPLTGYSFMLDQLIWGAENMSFGAHFCNIVLHFIAGCGFYACLRFLKFSPFVSGLAVLFWALHPQRPESVVWVSERKDVLILAMGLWSIFLFMLAKKRESIFLFFLCGVLFGLSFAVKPALIGIPAVLTAYLWSRYRRKDIGFYLKYTGAYWLMSFVCFGLFRLLGSTPGIGDASGVGETLAVTGWRFGNYLFKTFVPVGLNPFYPHFSMTDSSLLPLFAAGITGVVLFLFLYRRNRQAWYLYLPLFIAFSAAVAPALTYIGDVDFADRYSYFPSVFAVTAAACGICSFCNHHPRYRKAVAVIICGIVIATGYYGYCKIFVWENKQANSDAALDCEKPNYRCLIVLAVEKFYQNDLNGIERLLQRLNTDYINDNEKRRDTVNLFTASLKGVLLIRSGKLHQGLALLESVIVKKNWFLIFNSTCEFPFLVLKNTAMAYRKTGQFGKAAIVYRGISEEYKQLRNYFQAEYYSALAAYTLNDRAGAVRHFENALRIKPDDEVRKSLESLKKSR